MIKLKKNSIKLAGVLLFAALALGVGTTGAVIRHRMSLKNEIRTPTVEVGIDEEIGPVNPSWNYSDKQKKVAFENTGSADVFLRIAYSETWIYQSPGSEEKQILPNKDDKGGDIAAKFWDENWDENWYDGQDGWYYYKKVLPSAENARKYAENIKTETEEALTWVRFPKSYADSRYAEAEYQLHFQTEVVQASDELEVSKDAASEVFGKQILPYANGLLIMDDATWHDNKYTAKIDWPD